VAALARQDLALRPPAVGVGDRRGDLQVRRELLPHGVVLRFLEEAGPRRPVSFSITGGRSTLLCL